VPALASLPAIAVYSIVFNDFDHRRAPALFNF